MSRYLLFSVDYPPKLSLFRPSSLVDLGHVEILWWAPPEGPQSYGFYVSPTTWRRVLASVFWAQKARMIRGNQFVKQPSRWLYWRLSVSGLQAVKDFLEEVTHGCADGSIRYKALRFNCFHLAYQCLRVAELEVPSPSHQWVAFLPTIGASSFCKDLMGGAYDSVMDLELPTLLGNLPAQAPAEKASHSHPGTRLDETEEASC